MILVVLVIVLLICMSLLPPQIEGFTDSRFALVTSEDRNDSYIKLHDDNFREYCKKHNYTYIRKNNELIDNEIVPVYWYKLKLVKQILDSYKYGDKYDYVMWADSDTIVIDTDKKLESIVSSGKDIYIGTDYLSSTLNAGLFIIKNSEIGRAFINDCLKKLDDFTCFTDDYSAILKSETWAGNCYEQGYMNKVIRKRYKQYTEVVSSDIFYNTTAPVKSSFILHAFGSTSDIVLTNITKWQEYYQNMF